MADNELMKDAELDEVVGGSGAECIALMNRLQSAGLAKFKTPLVAGNEAAAAKELKSYLDSFKCEDGSPAFAIGTQIYSDGRANQYNVLVAIDSDGEMRFETIDADGVFEAIKYYFSRIA